MSPEETQKNIIVIVSISFLSQIWNLSSSKFAQHVPHLRKFHDQLMVLMRLSSRMIMKDKFVTDNYKVEYEKSPYFPCFRV